MKKILLLAFSALLLSSTASAQKLIGFGPKVGVNFSTVSSLKNVMSRAKADLTGGLFLEVRPIKWLGLSVEALYSAQGFKTNPITVGDWTASVDAALGYIATPIMAKFYFFEGMSVNVGYQPSFLVASHFNVGKENGSVFALRPVVSSIPVGVSYNFKWGLLLDLRYNIGLSNANTPFDINVGTDPQSLAIKNQVFTLSAGWHF